MSQRSKRELVERWRPKYQRVGKKYKGILLNEFCELTGHNRKHAIKLLRGKTGVRRHRAGRKPTYGEEVIAPLKAVWSLAGYPCSKLLVALLPEWLGYYETRVGGLPEETHQKVLAISAAQADRLLKPHRVGVLRSRWHGCKPGSLLRREIPVRTGPWDPEVPPGYLEMDTVAHCGGSMAGNFVWSLTVTDICTGWTCLRAVWNCGQHGVMERLSEIERSMPFPWLGADCDNGHEFLNHHLKRYLRQRKRPVEFTRSRPYHKNDNAHVEQKNWTHVRQLLGYDRFSHEALVPLINDLYSNAWEPFHNFFKPQMKLIKKVRVGSRYQKQYDLPRTPFQRLLDTGILSPEARQCLVECKALFNPLVLKQNLEDKLRNIFECLQRMEENPQPTRRRALRSDEPVRAHSRGAQKNRHALGLPAA